MNLHSAANLKNLSEVFIGWSLCVGFGERVETSRNSFLQWAFQDVAATLRQIMRPRRWVCTPITRQGAFGSIGSAHAH
jgi:hypothetical protein